MQFVFHFLAGIILLANPLIPNISKLEDSIATLLESSYYLSQHNPDSSKAVVERAIEISKDINNDTVLADCYIEMTYVQWKQHGEMIFLTEFSH